MNGKKNQYPQMTYKQAVERCKYCGRTKLDIKDLIY